MTRSTKIIMAVLTAKEKAKERLTEILTDTSGGGSTHTDNVGYVAVGFIIIGLIISWATGFLPKLCTTIGSKLTNLFN